MGIQCLVLDFDGTFTEVDKEAEPFIPAFRRQFEARLGIDVSSLWNKAEHELATNPDRYGWESAGQIVAPANADPYIRTTTLAQLVLAELPHFQSADARADLIQDVYRISYAATATVFRPEAAQTLRYLVHTQRSVFVVSNARPDVIATKIDQLAPDVLQHIRIYGDARKNLLAEPSEVSALFAQLPPATEALGGGFRPVWLRRGHYFDVLQRIWNDTNTIPEETLVCGDIFELDLAMPAALGCAIHLVTRHGTPAREIDAVHRLGNRGEVSDNLWGLAAHAMGIPFKLVTRDRCVIRLPASAREHLVAHPKVVQCLEEAAAQVTGGTAAQFLDAEIDFGRVVAASGCVRTPRIRPDELAQFSLRPNRRAPSRVIKGTAQPTSVVTISAKRVSAEEFRLLTAHPGPIAPPEPWDDDSIAARNLTRDDALAFWCRHALVWEPFWGEPFLATWDSVLKARGV